MLKRLYELWPDAPIERLVGDALYDHGKEFTHKLLFNWGIASVFPRAGGYSAQLDWVDNDGGPTCVHGQMKRKQADDFLIGAAKRASKGLAPGDEAPLDARIRWVCPNGVCRNETTYPVDDPRLYTYLARAGGHALRYEREALQVRRSAIESVFHMLKHYGVGGADSRPSWASDREMDWLLSFALLGITARRLAWHSGRYEQALAQATEFELMEQPTVGVPAPGPESAQVRAAIAARRDDPDSVRIPATWEALTRSIAAVGDPTDSSVLPASGAGGAQDARTIAASAREAALDDLAA